MDPITFAVGLIVVGVALGERNKDNREIREIDRESDRYWERHDRRRKDD